MAKAKYRKSQGIVPFGVGAIIDFPEDALMSAGLEAWPSESALPDTKRAVVEATRIIDGRLAHRLTRNLGRPIDYFLCPTEAPEQFGFGRPAQATSQPSACMPFIRFPEWHFCPRCRVLKRVPWNAQLDQNKRNSAMLCDNPGRRVSGGGQTCATLPENRKPRLIPVRFVAACEHGHIMDFPWSQWVHREDCSCNTGPHDLYLFSVGASGLEGLKVECIACGRKRSMKGAFTKDRLESVFPDGCPGHRPWLGPDACETNCQKMPQTIQRGASNAYFARVVSSILIPPHSERVRQILSRPETWELIEELPRQNGEFPRGYLERLAGQHGVEYEAFARAANDRMDGRWDNEDDDISEKNYRFREYEAFLGARPPREERLDFDPVNRPIEKYDAWFGNFFERIVLLKKLRETRALTGFSRVVPPEPGDGAPAQLSRKPKNWLPAMEVRGEGIFLVLNGNALYKWTENSSIINERATEIEKRQNLVLRERGLPDRDISPIFLLIHTFAHLLIRQLSYECGYDSSDLRERIYVSSEPSNKMHGVLIYTASGDSEGTMGGLVRQGEPGRLEGSIQAMLSSSLLCSSDPLCIESEGQGVNSLNLAACHACSLLSETSCEEGNKLLDRALVVGLPGNPGVGFFGKLFGT